MAMLNNQMVTIYNLRLFHGFCSLKYAEIQLELHPQVLVLG